MGDTVILRKVNDHLYYLGGVFSIVDLDKEFKEHPEKFDTMKWDELTPFGFDVIEVKYHKDYNTLDLIQIGKFITDFSRDYSKDRYARWDDENTIATYSENTEVNIFMAILRRSLHEKLPFVNVYSGRVNDNFTDNEYKLVLYEYGFHNVIWATIKGEDLKRFNWKELNIANWHDSTLCKYFTPYFERTTRFETAITLKQEVPDFVWEGFIKAKDKYPSLLKNGVIMDADLILLDVNDGRGKKRINKHLTILNLRVKKIQEWEMPELLDVLTLFPNTKIKTLAGTTININRKTAYTRASGLRELWSEFFYVSDDLVKESLYPFVCKKFPLLADAKTIINDHAIKSMAEYDLNRSKMRLPKDPVKYYGKEATLKRLLKKYG